MRRLLILLAVLILAAGCGGRQPDVPRLRLATTTSTQDSGLLDALLPSFEERYGVKVDVVAVGTGQALAIARRGDADLVLVHARDLEDQFISEGHGLERHDVMFNDFVLVGPTTDPAGIRGSKTAAAAFKKIAEAGALFTSRGDHSGTHTKEQAIWRNAAVQPEGNAWYRSLGQGMGETLLVTSEIGAYTLTDRGTFLSMREKLPALAILVGGDTIAQNTDPTLLNPYGIIPVNPNRHPGVNGHLATQFVTWITSPEIQQQIAVFGQERFGQSLFHPGAAPSPQSDPIVR
ncbi:MAG: tungsten ABC transporter substrate-binding protein [Herpetosiphonaceae bacterium]|nr:MAG: tungsten ABC transporter substrate-binding protein [Herpetosiphonaceae bacterium]